jgi:GNAT superfamily N-acetyltransferase
MVRIRKARLNDLDQLIELWKKFMAEHRKMGEKWEEDRIPPMKEEAPELVRKYYTGSIRSRNGYLLVLEDNGHVKGYMHSRLQKNIPVFKGDLVGYVAGIYLKDDYRGKGYSSKMFEDTMEWFKGKGVHEITIQVMGCNPHAHKVYQKWGFKDIHTMLRLDLD